MPSVFTNFATSRFVDREAVVEQVRRLARCLAAEHPEIASIHLFGSFATSRATPRSDADIAVVVKAEVPEIRRQLRRAAFERFLEAPVAVDLFILTPEQAAGDRGVAGAVRREGVRLA
jgi:predicted nucleotidyltransferase